MYLGNISLDILPGQTYLHEKHNEYVIVTSNKRGRIAFSGNGFRGMMDEVEFIEQFPPVNPTDIDENEVQFLLSLCPEEVEEATTGFILP